MYCNFHKCFILLFFFHFFPLYATDKDKLDDVNLESKDTVLHTKYFIPSKEKYSIRIEGLDLIKNRSPEPIAETITMALNKALSSDQLDFGEYLCQIEAIPVSPRVFILNCNHGKKYSLRAMFVRDSSDLRNATVRARAIKSHVNFAKLSISPKVFAYDVPHGILISEYIDNEPLKIKKIDYSLIEKLAILLKKIHITPKEKYYDLYHKREFSPYNFLKSSVEKVINLYPKQLSWHKETIFYMNLIYHILSPYSQKTICHYEMHPLNLLQDKETKKLYIIDWETAFVGDPMFDLATISCLSNFDQSHDNSLLSSYYEHSPSQEESAHFFLMKQHVYLFFSLQMIKSYNDPSVYMTDKNRKFFGILNSDIVFSHPLMNTPVDNYHYSVLLANTAYYHISTPDFYRNITIILSTYASKYRCLNQLHPNSSLLPWLFEYAKKTNKDHPRISAVSTRQVFTTSEFENRLSDKRLSDNVHYVFSSDVLKYQLQLTHYNFLLAIPKKDLLMRPILNRKQQFNMMMPQITKTYLGRKWLQEIFTSMETEEFLYNLVWKKHPDESYTLHSASLSKNKTYEDIINFIFTRLFEDKKGNSVILH